jgi:uncharacterized protein
MQTYPYLAAVLAASLMLAACNTTASRQSTPVEAATPLPSMTETLVPTLTPKLPSPTPLPAPTISPTPMPFPMSIQAMRAGSYPGSDIVIEQELAGGANYHRYYASYLSDGLKIYGLLTLPFGNPPPGGWPAIVFNHGYIPPQAYKTTERYIAYVDRLARAGYIVYKIDYRGHDRSEGMARGAYGDPGYEDDVLNALASLERFPQANPHKIGMWGHSMGGFLTLRAMVISKDIKVGVIWSGVVGSYADMASNWHLESPTPTPAPNARGWRREWTDLYGTPEQNPAFWESISATAFLADLSGPLELHASLTDEEVPSEFSKSLAEGGQAADKDVVLFTYANDDHNLSKNFATAMDRTISFLDQYIK